eukprot:CAMPEP_0194229606 /NCGR_PEP_ID=MMETSP0156-20130528/43980_1 /TAXON_ID=33649 /ORGANISM="Thalassionema nitzschioides, Strain L26-B" /LENGTH=272 /DNA_ID=CAMNT_0038962163 /DNA_START=167 /DNA_END=985 /DNA_ORIENTATION=+
MSYASAPNSARSGVLRAQSPVYVIDFSSQAAGKRVATSKRRVRWRWGYTNQDALKHGQTGNNCRGEEHDITLVWSVTSGKRQILMDGQEVHFIASRTNIVDYSWSTKGNHVIQVLAHASPPMSSGQIQPNFRQYDLFIDGQSFFTTTKGNHVIQVLAHASPPMSSGQIQPNFRQYDLFIDGQSFFTMPKVYELGFTGQQSAQETNYSMNRKKDQDEAELQRAIQDSIAESRRHLVEKRNQVNGNSSYRSYDGGGYSQGGYGKRDSYYAPSYI